MELNERQYERVARSLDGQGCELTGAEHRVADEIRRDEELLASVVEVEAPQAALGAAQRRMTAALALRRGRSRLIGYVAAAAAAAVIIAAATLWPTGTPPSGRQLAGPISRTRVFVEMLEESPCTGELALLERQLDELEAEILVDLGWRDLPATRLEAEFDEVEQAIEEFWSDERWPDLPES